MSLSFPKRGKYTHNGLVLDFENGHFEANPLPAAKKRVAISAGRRSFYIKWDERIVARVSKKTQRILQDATKLVQI